MSDSDSDTISLASGDVEYDSQSEWESEDSDLSGPPNLKSKVNLLGETILEMHFILMYIHMVMDYYQQQTLVFYCQF